MCRYSLCLPACVPTCVPAWCCALDAGKRVRAIFKEPTITPTEVQKKLLGLKKAWGSPNGAMRRGWNGITIRCV